MEYDLRRGHRERLRKKFLQGGMNALHDYEALELLLTYAIPRRDVKPLAKQLLLKFKDFSGVFDASVEQLQQVDGIGENAAALFVLLKSLCVKYLEAETRHVDVMNSPEAVTDFVRMKLGGLKKETFMVIYLNTKNHVIEHDIQPGTVDRAAVYPREVIHRALELHAISLILSHNHPSGICDPSPQDIKLTNELKKALDPVGIRMLDHVIVSKNTYLSFAKSKLLPK
jgi:DNA repair protein RadC